MHLKIKSMKYEINSVFGTQIIYMMLSGKDTPHVKCCIIYLLLHWINLKVGRRVARMVAPGPGAGISGGQEAEEASYLDPGSGTTHHTSIQGDRNVEYQHWINMNITGWLRCLALRHLTFRLKLQGAIFNDIVILCIKEWVQQLYIMKGDYNKIGFWHLNTTHTHTGCKQYFLSCVVPGMVKVLITKSPLHKHIWSL